MPTLLRASVVTVGTLLLIFHAKAQVQTTPPDTTAFIAYCEDHLESCRSTVVDINNIMMMRQLGGNRACSIPSPNSKDLEVRRANSRAATKEIVEWLKANHTSRAPKADDAVIQAIAALWPKECR